MGGTGYEDTIAIHTVENPCLLIVIRFQNNVLRNRVKAVPEILYEDEAIIVVDKPAGLLSQPGRRPEKSDCVISRLLPTYPDAVIVHRLDEPTSGLMVLARGKAMSAALSRSFRDRQVGKRYEALVSGLLAADTGSVDVPLSPDWPNRPKQRFDYETGRACLTNYTVMARNPEAHWTRVSLVPVTGRTHQLRMHMLSIGHVILGDPLYADTEVLARSPRLCLHACYLAFDHPVTAEPMAFESAVPF